MTFVFNDQDVAQLLSMKDCIAALEDAFREMGSGGAVNAPRRDSFMVSPRPQTYYSFKTIEGGLESLGVVAQRINSDLITHPVTEGVARRVKVPAAPGNRYVGLVFLYSSETLELLAVMTDGHLQRMRVAGVTGVGAKYLAREDSREAALLGSGSQAETAAWALASVRPIATIRVFSPTPSHREAFAEKLAGDLGIQVTAVESPMKAVKGADIVATATNSTGTVVRGDWIEPGTHLTCIRVEEFDEEAWRKSDLINFSSPSGSEGYFTHVTKNFETLFRTRDLEGARIELEDERFERYREKTYFLWDMLTNRAPKRTSSSQITLMNKHFGLGIEFASVAKFIYDQARTRGIGQEMPTEWFSQTSHP
jgi:ornithine cyclodeaminase/alanine dehydrogenase-like protein (mu-crystallin family)